MEPNTTLRLDRVGLTNFRCFTGCELELDPCLTVIIAENAQGKTALLNAITIALDVFVAAIGEDKFSQGFDRSDIHLIRDGDKKMMPAPAASFVAEGLVNGEAVKWERNLSSASAKARSSTKDTKAVRIAAERLAARLSQGQTQGNVPVTLPSVAFYGTGRLWNEHRLTASRKWKSAAQPGRINAYLDCLSPSSSFKAFSTWYEDTANSLRSSTSKALGKEERPEQLLAAVRKSVATVLEPTGWTLIDWEFPRVDENGATQGRGHLVVEHANRGRLPLSSLSDGVRNMVALVGDLAHRCARLNPHLGEGAALLTPGILLIDEVDMHLHPSWQQLVVDLLERAFPLMQKVYTTHSPQVLTTVKEKCIRKISQSSDGVWHTRGSFQETKGVESTAALSAVMGVNPVPPIEEAQWLKDYTVLIENGTHETAHGQQIRAKLNSHYGEHHSVILDCDRLIRFQAFKSRKSPDPRP